MTSATPSAGTGLAEGIIWYFHPVSKPRTKVLRSESSLLFRVQDMQSGQPGAFAFRFARFPADALDTEGEHISPEKCIARSGLYFLAGNPISVEKLVDKGVDRATIEKLQEVSDMCVRIPVNEARFHHPLLIGDAMYTEILKGVATQTAKLLPYSPQVPQFA